jgi:Uma2 family endonuclease
MTMLKMIAAAPENRADHGYSLYYPLENNCEIINGEPSVIPNPGIKHKHISIRLTANLLQRLENEDRGIVLGAPCNVMLTPWDIVQPDILFVRKNRKGIIGERIILGPPDLIVEILSDSTWERDLKTKRRIYADSGVREYWIVDAEAETIEPQVWCEIGYISSGIYDKGMHLSSPLLSNLKLPLSKIFQSR